LFSVFFSSSLFSIFFLPFLIFLCLSFIFFLCLSSAFIKRTLRNMKQTFRICYSGNGDASWGVRWFFFFLVWSTEEDE
jgi:hypothetical protein